MKTAHVQSVHASSPMSMRARATLAAMAFAGPTARQEVKNAAQTRCLMIIAQIIAGTQTPLGPRRRVSSVGMGLGILRPFFQCLTQAKLVTFRVLDVYLQLRVAETCTRNAFKCLHEAFG